jgi:hypothetical protein
MLGRRAPGRERAARLKANDLLPGHNDVVRHDIDAVRPSRRGELTSRHAGTITQRHISATSPARNGPARPGGKCVLETVELAFYSVLGAGSPFR